MSHDYLLLGIFLVIAVAFPLIPLALARAWSILFSPPKPGADKGAIYECGVESPGAARIQFQSHYYLYALVFLIFDVEVIFLLPFAVVFLDLSIAAFLAMMVFLLLLVEGLVWAWAKGVLEWK